MSADLAALEERALAELQACAGEPALRAWNTRYFGTQGELALALKKVGDLPAAERPAYGQKANQVKQALTTAYESAVTAEKELRSGPQSLRRRP